MPAVLTWKRPSLAEYVKMYDALFKPEEPVADEKTSSERFEQLHKRIAEIGQFGILRELEQYRVAVLQEHAAALQEATAPAVPAPTPSPAGQPGAGGLASSPAGQSAPTPVPGPQG